jgi:hypothetical protein
MRRIMMKRLASNTARSGEKVSLRLLRRMRSLRYAETVVCCNRTSASKASSISVKQKLRLFEMISRRITNSATA